MMESKPNPESKTGGLLLKAFRENSVEGIQWVEIKLDDMILTVASDALKASLGDLPGVRLPVSYHETIEICRALGCIAPTQAMADAMFAQASYQLTLVPLVRTTFDSARMTTIAFTLRFHEGVERQLAELHANGTSLVAGAWKYWLLHPRLVERGAVNYGFWDMSQHPPRPVQTVGAQHDAEHYDYSQLLQPIKRFAKHASTGADVDLLDYVAVSEKVPEKFLTPYK